MAVVQGRFCKRRYEVGINIGCGGNKLVSIAHED